MHGFVKIIRVIICIVVMLMFTAGFILSLDYPDAGPKMIGYLNLLAAMLAGYVLVRTFRRPPKTVSAAELEKELEQAGLLEIHEFRARRAIMVEEFEDEGLYYLLDVGDGNTLCLTGQELYDYEPMTEKDDGVTSPRAFPNTHFVLKLHKIDRYTVALDLLGSPFEPEHVFEHFKGDDFKFDRVMENGQIISHPTFDEIIKNQGRISSGERAVH